MPGAQRVDKACGLYYALNRGNFRSQISWKNVITPRLEAFWPWFIDSFLAWIMCAV